MTTEVPEICANLPIVGRLIWRLTEGKHIVKLEITWQLPKETIQRRSDQRSSKKSHKLADGVTGGVTKMANKMATPPLTTTEEEHNVYAQGLLGDVSGTLRIPQLTIPRKESGRKWYRRRNPGRSCPHARPPPRTEEKLVMA